MWWDELLGYIVGFWEFLTSPITAIVELAGAIEQAVVLPLSLAEHMPPFLSNSIIVCLALWVVRFLLLR